MNATRFFNNLNPPDNSMKKASATSKWEISLTDEERKLICNSGKWLLSTRQMFVVARNWRKYKHYGVLFVKN